MAGRSSTAARLQAGDLPSPTLTLAGDSASDPRGTPSLATVRDAMQGIWERIVQTVQGFGWEEKLVIGLVGLAILTAIAIYAVRRVRSGLTAPMRTVTDHLTDFRRMRDSGELDEQEFSRVINVVSEQESTQRATGAKSAAGKPEPPGNPPQKN
jgi:hypothetical protein